MRKTMYFSARMNATLSIQKFKHARTFLILPKEKDYGAIHLWLKPTGFWCVSNKIVYKAGVRIFVDYIKLEVLANSKKLKKIKEVENAVRRKDECWILDQLVHYVISN